MTTMRITNRRSLLACILFAFCVAPLLVVGQETAEAEPASATDEIVEDAVPVDESASATVPEDDNTVEDLDEAASATEEEQTIEVEEEPVQTGPFIDLFGTQLYSMEIIDETSAQLRAHYTNEALAGKKVVGVYFSADWCGPCRQFTPELVSFYEKMNKRRGKKDSFQIVWVSRCRDVNSYAQYFAHMPGFYALPPEEAMGQRGQMLAEKYKVKGIPSLTLLDDLGNIITTDARNKIPQDKAGVGFPWRSPLAQITSTFFPRSLRLMIKMQIDAVKYKLIAKIKGLIGLGPKVATAA